MRKHIIAAAVAAAVAAPAMAQNVTLYGAIGASHTSAEIGTAKAAVQTQGISQDHWKTTRLGLTGSEDLGGGMKAFFNLEGDLSGAGGALGAGGGSGTDVHNIFNRQSHVGISGPFGTFSAGRQNDSVKDIEILGNAINLTDNLFNVTTVGDRIANAYKYVTPTLSGFNASVTYSDSRTDATGAAGSIISNSSVRHQSYAISGTIKGIRVAVASGEEVTTTAKSSTTRAGIDVPINASWSVGANYTTNKIDTSKLNQFMVQAKFVSGPWEVYGTYGAQDPSGANLVAVSARGEGSVYQLIAGYNLSKRTALYAGYSNFSADGASASARDEKYTTVGVFHSF